MSLSNSAFRYRSACISKVRLCLYVLSLLASPPLLQLINFCSHFIFPEESPQWHSQNSPFKHLLQCLIKFAAMLYMYLFIPINHNLLEVRGNIILVFPVHIDRSGTLTFFLLTKLNNRYGTERQIAWCSGHGFWTRLP